MTVFTVVGTFTVHTCPTDGCGVKYALDADFDRRRSDEGGSWRCPNGHMVMYTKSEVKRLQYLLEDAQRQAIFARNQRDAARSAKEAERRSHAATKGALTKVRKRIGKGVCPNCNRHFENVERHMASKHPEPA